LLRLPSKPFESGWSGQPALNMRSTESFDIFSAVSMLPVSGGNIPGFGTKQAPEDFCLRYLRYTG
jgi:hypothetical protein